MTSERIVFSRGAQAQLAQLPTDVRMQVETHLENVAALLGMMPPERLVPLLQREGEGFLAVVERVRILFTVDMVLLKAFVQSIHVVPATR